MKWEINDLSGEYAELIKLIAMYRENNSKIVDAIINSWANNTNDIFALNAKIIELRYDVKKAINNLRQKTFVCKNVYSKNYYNCKFKYCYYDIDKETGYEIVKAVFEIIDKDPDLYEKTVCVEID